MSNQTETKVEDSIVVPDYDKHKLDKNCYNCAVGHMEQKTPDGLYYQLTELTNGKYICDGDECFDVMMEVLTSIESKKCLEQKDFDSLGEMSQAIMKSAGLAPKKEEEEEDMKTISWVSQNSKYIDFTIDRSNEPDTEPESDTDYDTDDLPSDDEEE